MGAFGKTKEPPETKAPAEQKAAEWKSQLVAINDGLKEINVMKEKAQKVLSEFQNTDGIKAIFSTMNYWKQHKADSKESGPKLTGEANEALRDYKFGIQITSTDYTEVIKQLAEIVQK